MSRARSRPAATLAACALVLAAAGCGAEAGESPSERTAPPVAGSDERVIRAWSDAVNAGDYDRAANLFARGAIVQQIVETRLRTHADAVEFNSGLPCRADVTGVREARGDSTIADFSLREGRTGECSGGGRASVRFVIRDGKIEEWRQLPAPAPRPPPGDVA